MWKIKNPGAMEYGHKSNVVSSTDWFEHNYPEFRYMILFYYYQSSMKQKSSKHGITFANPASKKTLDFLPEISLIFHEIWNFLQIFLSKKPTCIQHLNLVFCRQPRLDFLGPTTECHLKKYLLKYWFQQKESYSHFYTR